MKDILGNECNADGSYGSRCAHPNEDFKLLVNAEPETSTINFYEVVHCPDCNTWISVDEWLEQD